MHWLHTLWFTYATPGLKRNGSTVALQTLLGVALTPLLKRYLKPEAPKARRRLRAALAAFWAALVRRQPKAPQVPNTTEGAPKATTMAAE